MNYTTIEQSKKLVELGLSPDTADMHYFIGDITNVGVEYNSDAAELYSTTAFEYIPCWSVGALIAIMPVIELDDVKSPYIPLTYQYKSFVCKYESHDDVMGLACFRKDNLIDACFEMICWLIEKGYLI